MGILDAPAYSRAAADSKFAPIRKPTIILFGDSRTADCNYADATNAYSTNMSWFDWGQMNNADGPVFDVIRNAGIGGNTTTQMLARLKTDVLDYAPSYMTLWGGTNDGWAAGKTDVDATFDRMVQIMQTANKAGIYVFLISETTCSTKGNAFQPLVQYYNERLRGFAAGNPGVEFWDFNSVMIGPTSSVGNPNTLMVRDGLHLSAYGAATLGQQVVAKKLARFGTSLAQLPNSIIDTMGNNSTVRNIFSNPLNQGTGGTLGSGGHTGTLPDGWASSGTPTAAFSTPARADGIGNDVQAVITASGASSLFLTYTGSTARITPGKKYVVEASLGIEAASNLFSLSLINQVFNGATTYSYGHGIATQSAVSGDTLIPAPNLTLRSRVFTAPTGFTYTGLSLTFTARFAGAGSATVRLGRFAVKSVD